MSARFCVCLYEGVFEHSCGQLAVAFRGQVYQKGAAEPEGHGGQGWLDAEILKGPPLPESEC